MKILGVTGPIHDTSAAIIVDGRVVAAAEEERFTRSKHAYKTPPAKAVAFCLKQAGLKPSDIDAVAYPWNLDEFKANAPRHFVRSAPQGLLHAANSWLKVGKRFRKYEGKIQKMLRHSGIDMNRAKWVSVPHHLAHAASSFHLSGFDKAAVMTIDALGEYITSQFCVGEGRNLRILHNDHMPHSFGCFYTSMTEYLGFESNDGEYKLMGMAPFGDGSKIDLSKVAWVDGDGFHVNPDYIWVSRKKSYNGKLYSKKLVELLGPPRVGDAMREPYTHIAAAVQDLFVKGVMSLVDKHLGGVLKDTGNLAFAGGCALNVSLNRHLIARPDVKRLWVQPASNDAGTSLGAAAYAAVQLGEKLQPMDTAYLGPEYSSSEIRTTLDTFRIPYEECKDIEERVAELLAKGTMVGWMQGRMEYGPRALGNRSILGSPAFPEMADTINERVKFREKWRPFCPSILGEYAQEILQTDHPSPYMTFSFTINPAWKPKIPEVVHVDGSGRPQVVTAESNPRFYKLLKAFHRRTGVPVVINTSFNRRGEPMVCSPQDALTTFYNCGLEYLAIGDFLIRKPHVAP